MIKWFQTMKPIKSNRKVNYPFYLLCFVFILLSILYFAEPYDDSFISYRVTKNLVNGFGFRFNPAGGKVEGFSNFLWVMLLSLFLKLGFNIVKTSSILCMWLSIGSLYLSYRLAQKFFKKFAIAVPLLIVLTDFFLINTLNGLETSLFSFLLILTCYCFLEALDLDTSDTNRSLFFLFSSLSCFLIGLTRPEGPIVFLVLFFFLFKEKWEKLKVFAKDFLFLSLPFSILYTTYFVWRFFYFGYFFPNTYYARQLTLFSTYGKQLAMGGFYLTSFFSDQIAFLLIIILLPLLFKKEASSSFKFLAFILLSYLGFIFLAGGDWNHMLGTWRFVMPLVPIFSLLFLQELFALSKKKNDYLILSGICLFFILSHIKFGDTTKQPAHINFEMARRDSLATLILKTFKAPIQSIKYQSLNFLTNKGISHVDAKVGLWLKQNYPKKSLLASQQAGRLAYFSKLPFLDISGLVSTHIAHLPKTDYFQKKHMDYIFSQSPDLFVFPVTVMQFKAASFFTPYFEKHGYRLSKVFCPARSFYIFDVYQRLYETNSRSIPDNYVFYYLCLFEKVKETDPPPLNDNFKLKLIFENKWYSISEEDLMVFK